MLCFFMRVLVTEQIFCTKTDVFKFFLFVAVKELGYFIYIYKKPKQKKINPPKKKNIKNKQKKKQKQKQTKQHKKRNQLKETSPYKGY